MSGRQRTIVIAVLVALGLLVLASVRRVAPDERAYRRSVLSGEVGRLQPGWRIAVPFIHRVVRLTEGPLRVTGEVSVESSSGEILSLPYEVWAAISEERLADLLAGSGGGRDPEETMRRTAAETLRGWADRLDSESIVLMRGGAAAEEEARGHLEEIGFEGVVVAFHRATAAGDRVETITREALAAGRPPQGGRVALFGVDGADWQIIDPLIERGELPNLARLKAGGAWGNIKAMTPMLSPLLWTTVATGVSPDRHGIIDFLVRNEATGESVPVSSHRRKVKALWNIYTDAERESAFIAWWASWPAEEVFGHLVSDRVAYSLFGYESSAADLQGATHPPSYFEHIRPELVDDSSITLAELQRFAPIEEAMFADQREQLKSDRTAIRLPVNQLRKILSSSQSYQTIALDILSRGQPDLFALYYQGLDEIGHRFAHYMPPKMEMVSDEEFQRYRGVVDEYYRYQDRQLGQVLDALEPDTTVIVLSDHGFENGSSRPKGEPPYIEGKPGLWHRRYGIVIFSGPDIRPGRLDTTSLLDIAPTILYLAGLPVAEDMEGRVVEEAIAEPFLSRQPRRTLASYERIGQPPHRPGEALAGSSVDQEMMEQLRALGYVGGGGGGTGGAQERPISRPAGGSPQGETLITGHLNEASLYMQKGDYRAAEEAVDKALAIAPDFVGAWLVKGQVASEQKDYEQAIEAGHKVLELSPDGERHVYTQLGHVYADAARLDEGLAYLRGMAASYPDIGEIRAAIGALLLEKGEREAAEEELLASLRIDPALSEPLAELHTLFRGTERILELEEIVREGLALDDKSVVHHNWMGLIHEWRKETVDAEREFKLAIELDPEYTATMANLGALYGRTGRLEEAIAILSRAEAIEALETARGLGARTTTLYNALALAYLQARQRDKALEYLRESLEIDPDQKDARDLLNAVSRPS
jgi:tetratricopeptide (TPR) repeat protein/predicted AlkP superfamily pyrophosphatase or phosphodiesterase